MAANKFRIGLVLQIFSVAVSSYTEQVKMIPDALMLIDTDGVGDDAATILMAVLAEKLDKGPKVIGITCVNGNAKVHDAAVNILKTLKIIGRLDIPVFKGADSPLLEPFIRDQNRFGKDGLGDFYYPDPPSADLIQKEHAVNAMINIVKAHPGKVILLSIAPLTNIALAIRLCPEFLNLLHQLIVMGGSTEGRGNAAPGIDGNSFIDPPANHIVFTAPASRPAMLVPIETTRRADVTMDFRMELSKSKTKKMWLLDSAEALYLDRRNEFWECPDAVALVIPLTYGCGVTESSFYYMDAIYDGSKTKGMTVIDYTNITKNHANVHLIKNVNSTIYKKLLIKYLTT